MRILFRISSWILNLVGMLALIAWLVTVGFKVTWKPFEWTNLYSIQFVVGAGLLGLSFILGILGIVFRTARVLKKIISFVFCIIGMGALGILAYNSGMWLQQNNAWTNFKDIENGILNICLFSVPVSLIGSYIIFGILLIISKAKK